jgi:hypothetical protein
MGTGIGGGRNSSSRSCVVMGVVSGCCTGITCCSLGGSSAQVTGTVQIAVNRWVKPKSYVSFD